ncbi:MAG: hemerythrin [Acidimicrobiales bacterium]|nr:hemerythrin [Acidimicrobiales bacterium]
MDAITLLKDDHKAVEKLFKRFEKAGDNAHAEKRRVVDRIIEELSIHAAVEEQLFYPVTRATVPATEDMALESLEEHHIVKWVLSELERMDPADERFDAKVTVLIENVRHHVEEEEGEYFPQVRDELGRKALGELGDAMAEAKKRAPTHPHPRSPDTPPGNIVVGAAAAAVDRATDAFTGAAQGSLAAAQDVIARVTGANRRGSSSPNGSTTARSSARRARSSIDEAADKVTAAAERAKRTGEATVDSARTGAKRTGSTARGAARRTTSAGKGTATTAKRAARRTTGSARGTATTAKRGAARTKAAAKGAATQTRRSASRAGASS